MLPDRQWRCLAVLLVGLLGALGPAAALGGEGAGAGPRLDLTVAQAGGGMGLSLKESVALALQNNLDVAIERFTPQIREQDLQGEEAAFHPSAFLQVERSDRRLPSRFSFGQGSGLSDTWTFDTGLRQKLPTGGTYELRFDNDHINAQATPSSNYSSRLALILSQPLLKNFGVEATRTGIRIATNSQAISREQLRLKVSDIVTQVHTAYFDLIFTLENLEVQRRSLQLARELVTLNRARVRAGVAAPVEVTQAEAQEAARLQDVIVAEKGVRDAEDALRVILNLPASAGWGQELQPTDRLPFTLRAMNLEGAIRAALENRFEFKSARLDIENRELSLRLTRNQLLPDLALTGTVSANGGDRTYAEAFSSVSSDNFLSYGVGLLLTVPLGNQGPRAAYLKAKLAVDQARTSIRQLELQITQQVREAVRRVEADAKRVEANRAARALAEEQLRVEQRRLEAGVTTTFNVLSFQRDLAAAQANEIRAITDYNKSLAILEKVQGTVLEKNQIEM